MIINREFNRHYNVNDINQSDANKHRMTWLSSLNANSSSRLPE